MYQKDTQNPQWKMEANHHQFKCTDASNQERYAYFRLRSLSIRFAHFTGRSICVL